jgi:glycosyltransferase involved in cell wall biosynthesis/tetratricopeptide (TPR) repeat protein
MVKHGSKSILFKMRSKVQEIFLRSPDASFDPKFYHKHYADLHHLRSAAALQAHYFRFGQSEGRFANRAAYHDHVKATREGLAGDFDLTAYRHYNRDLWSHFQSDDEFLEHYLTHGRRENRPCAFPPEEMGRPAALVAPHEKWTAIFSMSQMISWCGDRLAVPPATREQAVAIFRDIGIDELWPINFDYIFDPAFYRSVYVIPNADSLTDGDLYRHWLVDGFSSGAAPNERQYLHALLGGAPFPRSFNWARYATHAKLSAESDRFDVLKHLFDQGSKNISRYREIMGSDYLPLLNSIGRYLFNKGRFDDCVAVMRGSLIVEESANAYFLLGEGYRGKGQITEALKCYGRSLSLQGAPISAFLYSIEILSKKRDFDGAFVMLKDAFRIWRHKEAYHGALHLTMERYFEHQSAQAHQLYRRAARGEKTASRAAADELMWQALDRIAAMYLELDVAPPTPRTGTGTETGGYVAFLGNDSLKQCTHYRIEQKSFQFDVAGLEIKIFAEDKVSDFTNSLVGAQAAIFYRVPANPSIIRAILSANRMGLPTYYEIDDLIFDAADYPDDYASFDGQISLEEYAGLQFGVPLFRYAMALCRNNIASTAPLADKMSALNGGKSIVVRNGLDARNDAAVRMGAIRSARSTGKIRIFYGSGTKAHNADFNDIVGQTMIDIMDKFPEVELVIVGHLKLGEGFDRLNERIRIYRFITDIDVYWSILASCDINIAVLHRGAMADCKSEIKWLEAAVLQIPSVVTGTAVYRAVIDDGVNGYIATTAPDWRTRLERLIVDHALRREMGMQARAKALRDYDVREAAKIWVSEFARDRRVPASEPSETLRVLVCNVFFYPQSIGGATRVVEDNVRHFAEHCDDLTIGVFCSDEGGPAGRLRIGSFGEIPVYRVGTVARKHMDWHPFDTGNVAIFERVLEHFKPDLIHFHCIQRLSGSIVEVALKRDIPYIVTLHDGWWISDNQFLVDTNGVLKLPTADVLQDCAASRVPVRAVERRQRLGALLRGAQARLSVSEPFARIYVNAGIDDVLVIENGVTPLKAVEPTRRADGRVALGHIGGRASHKGADLVQAVLLQNRFSNLHLTMVDGTLHAGQSIDTVWGTTPVTLTAPYQQSEVTELYSRLDILLAPSTWPESFGLVTREALSVGLWVIASDLGAIGQGVENDINGYVIDTRTPTGLRDVLRLVDDDPAKYREPPSRSPIRARPTADQAIALHGLYRKVVERYRGGCQRTNPDEA